MPFLSNKDNLSGEKDDGANDHEQKMITS